MRYIVLGVVIYGLLSLVFAAGFFHINKNKEWYKYDDKKFLKRDSRIFGVLWAILFPLSIFAYVIELYDRFSSKKDKKKRGYNV